MTSKMIAIKFRTQSRNFNFFIRHITLITACILNSFKAKSVKAMCLNFFQKQEISLIQVIYISTNQTTLINHFTLKFLAHKQQGQVF